MLTAREIRQKFLAYFEKNKHTIIASASLIPRDDPTLLFTNSGMVPFKNVFLGHDTLPNPRATTVQKSLRVSGKHNDLENVGRTARHHTFFEMLGNFSFGDYFKKDAMHFAWNFVTKELGLDIDKLYVTVYIDDDEAFDLWKNDIGIDEKRIFRIAGKDNFWSMGDTGPCGPCSEIFVDQGQDMTCGDNCGIGKCDCDRFLEIWNLVFMQFNQLPDGTKVPLEKPCIDTGMGLERISAICQGKRSNFDNDLFQEIISFTAQDAGVIYSHSMPDTNDVDTALRVIADHSRAAAFLITEGILPSNEGRGYVLRRLVRRALRFGTLIGLSEAFMYKTVGRVIDLMQDVYPELQSKKDFVMRAVREEEERFRLTLEKGLLLLEEEMSRLEKEKKGVKIISGEVAFKLYDTYGFPIDIVDDIARKRDFTIDEAGYAEEMNKQKERARSAWKGSGEKDLASQFKEILEAHVKTYFIGYTQLKGQSSVLGILATVENVNGNKDTQQHLVDTLLEGQHGYVLTHETPFYGASGGQVGDTGLMLGAGTRARVCDTIKVQDLTVHEVIIEYGNIAKAQEVELEVTGGERIASARNHTCTHLLHKALQEILGDHVQQAGSLVAPDRLRFDFTHIAAMSSEEVSAVEARVNEMIMSAYPVRAEEMSQDRARQMGATALFGEKYGDIVRVLSIGSDAQGEVPVSIEFCGGTHLENSGQAGAFVIMSESGISAGTRRIEALTGWNALQYLAQLRKESQGLCQDLKARPGELIAKVDGLQKEIRQLRKDLDKANSSGGADIMQGMKDVHGVKVLAKEVPSMSAKALRDLMDDVRTKIPSGVACLVAKDPNAEGKLQMLLYVSKDLHTKFTAPALIKEVALSIDGSGGGRPDLAQAGGTNPAGIASALATLEALLGKGKID